MKQKLMFLMVMTLILVTVFLVSSVVWSFEKKTVSQIPENQIFPTVFKSFEKTEAYCEIQNDINTPDSYYPGFDSLDAVAVYMNPAVSCQPPYYPFKITDVHLYMYPDDENTNWPVNIRVNIREVSSGDSCAGPGDILCSEDFSIPVESAYPSMVTLNLSTLCCVNQPFFLEIMYKDSPHAAPYHPSPLFNAVPPSADTCVNWTYWREYEMYFEWYETWVEIPGNLILRATGYTNDEECGEDTCWYWKADKPDQEFPVPSGMPDFDQFQFDDSMALCGPTAVANCLWWYNAVPPDTSPPDLIRLLCTYFKCEPIQGGTYVSQMQLGLDQYILDYGFDLYERTYYQPDFLEMEDSLKKSQDIILLLGFWQMLDKQWERIGGHFVTMAGVCSESLKVALSDPARDMAVWFGLPGRIRPPSHPVEYPPTLHNDPTYVSQDMYTSTLESPSPGNPFWGMDYPYYILVKGEKPPFLGQNFQPGQEYLKGTYIPEQDVFTEVEYAVMICPGEWYWKPDTTHAPSGMPDFDQNQDDWESYCGPTAVANCLWWYDAVPEGWNPPQLIDTLARYFHTNPQWGTYVDTMQMGLDQYFTDYGFALQESTFWMPDFNEMEDSLKRCQDIILLLGFWWYDGEVWWREGGHFVTMAGVNSEGGKITLSDPDRDAAVLEGRPGRVRPPEHPKDQYPATLHNDPTYVSQDLWDCTFNPDNPSPGNPHWEIDDYIETIRGKYSNANVPQRFLAYTKPAPKDKLVEWHTEVEAAIMVCPKPSAVEGEEDAFTPQDFELYQNYPNPFNNETIIKFSLAKPAEVNLTIYNILGQKVRTLVEGRLQAGSQTIKWDGKDEKGNDLSSGIYFYQLKRGELTQTKRLVLLK
jgi:hypothetical protein